MRPELLILYTRKGCCLCSGLEQRLKSISLQALKIPLTLKVIDIDSDELSDELRIRFDLQVPVMAVSLKEKNRVIELPRVSPRLKEKELFIWIEKTITNLISDSRKCL